MTDTLRTETVNILKKNRVYFACESDSGFKYKLRIDDASRELTTGQHTLMLKDVSVKSKYGTDFIYEVSAVIEEEAGICTFKPTLFNYEAREKCKSAGGKWDADESAWVFPAIMSDVVEEIEETYETDIVWFELTTLDNRKPCYKPSSQRFVTVCGYYIASTYGRDDKAKICEGVHLVSGDISSSGSMKNYFPKISEGSVIRLQMPRAFAERLIADYAENYTYTILEA